MMLPSMMIMIVMRDESQPMQRVCTKKVAPKKKKTLAIALSACPKDPFPFFFFFFHFFFFLLVIF